MHKSLQKMKRERSSNRRMDEAIVRYENSVKGGKLGYFEVDELEAIINHYMDGSNPKEAMEAVRYGQRLHPNSTALLTKQAKLYADTGETQKALSIITYVQSIDSGDEDAALLKGEILLRKGMKEEATRIFEELSREGEYDCSTLLNIAYALNDNRLFDEALTYLRKAHAMEEKNTDVLYEIAYCQEQKEQFDDAMLTYNAILDIDPYANEAWFNLGQLHLFHEDYEHAIEAYDYAYAITPTDYQSLFQKANALYLSDHLQEAVEGYEEYMDFTGETANCCILIGECYEKMSDFTAAETFYAKALRLDERNVDALTGLCICALENGDSKLAIGYVEKAREIKGDSSEFWIYEAEAFVIANQQEAAIQCYQNALKINPNQLDALMTLGSLHADLGEYETALSYYERAKRVQNDVEGLSLLLAITFYKMEQYEMSYKHLREAVQENATALQSFFDICPEAMGDPNIKK